MLRNIFFVSHYLYHALKYPILMVLLFLISFQTNAQNEIKQLDQNWTFSCNDSNLHRSASIPGSIFTDLMFHNIISDPLIKDHEKSSQWVSKQTWTYFVHFNIDKSILKKYKFAEISLGGIDTYADVYLNDVLILSCNNAFRPWKKEIKSLLKMKNNQIKLIFPPIEEILKKKAEEYPFTLPEGLRVFARKPQFHFGWDWAPKILNASIYKPVSIRFWNNLLLDEVVVHSSEFSNGNGILMTTLYPRCSFDKPMEFDFSIENMENGETLYSSKIKLLNNKPQQFEIKLKNIKQWSIHHPNYYDLTFRLSNPKFGEQSITKRVGFRSIQLKQPKDEVGAEFYFELNGEKIFSKGANWVPADVFRHRITDKTYRNLLILAKDAGFNMIRVWGGGYYEDDAFYNLCDSLGILVWQDFMFACSMYPFGKEFTQSVKEEADYQLKRLSGHPSIALWCGNNENTEGWFNWGWQKEFGYSKTDSAQIWKENHEVFYNNMPKWCNAYTKKANYHPSSPAHGWGRKEAYTQGDVHYWGVWWGYEPFEKYFEKVGRFVSEYGFQGYPQMSTLEYMMQGKVDRLLHPFIQHHQKHPKGQHTIETYMQRDFEIPNQVEDYIYVSQMLQSEGVGKAITAHRLAMPYCMGTLYWQYNDCWPSISWASVDVFNQPKALYYRVKQLYKEIAPFIVQRNDSILLYISNLTNNKTEGKAIIGRYDVENSLLLLDTLDFSCDHLSNQIIHSFIVDSNFVYALELQDSRNNFIGNFTHFSNVNLIQKMTNAEVQANLDSKNRLKIETKQPIFGLWIEHKGLLFSENAMHIFPGFTYLIEGSDLSNFDIKTLKTNSLNSVYKRLSIENKK